MSKSASISQKNLQVPVAREAILAGIDLVHILIHLDHMSHNASIHVIGVARAENLDMPFNLLYHLKDDSEKLMSTFRDVVVWESNVTKVF